jgi:hypothetical protein
MVFERLSLTTLPISVRVFLAFAAVAVATAVVVAHLASFFF